MRKNSKVFDMLKLDDQVFEIIFYLLQVVEHERLPVKKEIDDRRFQDVYRENITFYDSVC